MDGKAIAQYASNAGLSIEKIPTAVAIAMAESSGNEKATNTNNNGSIDVGLWQINSVHKKAHPNWTIAWLQNPANNASAMMAVSGGGSNWSPWVAYKNGAYKQYLDKSTGIDDTPILGDLAEGINSTTDFLRTITGALANATQWIVNSDNWIRIIQVIGGVGLGLIAASIVASPIINKVR